MAKGRINLELRKWRKAKGLTMEEAGALIVVNGKPVDKVTWHGWEVKGRIPKEPWMVELELVTGVQPNAFYPRPDGGASRRADPPVQTELAL